MSTRAKRHQPPEFVRHAQSLRGSGAAGPHGDRRTRRVRDRGTAKRTAIDANRDQ